MDGSISISDIYAMLKGLSANNKQWLADHLIEDVHAEKQTTLRYPHLEKNSEPSKETLSMVAGTLPSDFDYDKERIEMWEALAK